MEFLRSILRRHLVGKPALSVWVGSGYSLPGWGNQSWRRRYVDCFHTLILRVLCGNLKQLLYTLRFRTHQDKNLFLNRRMSNTKGAFHWDDPDKDQWSEITRIMMRQRNHWIHSRKVFIGSFDQRDPSSLVSLILDADHSKGTHPKLAQQSQEVITEIRSS